MRRLRRRNLNNTHTHTKHEKKSGQGVCAREKGTIFPAQIPLFLLMMKKIFHFFLFFFFSFLFYFSFILLVSSVVSLFGHGNGFLSSLGDDEKTGTPMAPILQNENNHKTHTQTHTHTTVFLQREQCGSPLFLVCLFIIILLFPL